MEIYSIPLTDPSGGESCLVYRPLIGLAFAGNRALFRLAQELSDLSPQEREASAHPEVVQFLSSTGFFEPDPAIADGLVRLPDTLVLLLTNQCQLRCVYCYAAAGTKPKKILSSRTANQAIDYMVRQVREAGIESYQLAFHGGGEPTFPWDLLVETVEYAHRQPVRAEVSLTTNATWPKAQREWLLAHVDKFGISMDGGQTTQNRQRPFANGRPSSRIVMQNLAELDRRSAAYGIRMTATPPWEALAEDVRFICEHTACRSIQVEPAFNTLRGSHDLADAADCAGFAAAFLAAHRIARQYRCRLSFSGARPGLVAPTFCSAPFSSLIVSPEDEIVSCYEITDADHPLYSLSVWGSVSADRILLERGRLAGLHARLAERRAACRPCFSYWSCAGDCYTRTFLPEENGHLVFSPRCDMNRTILKNLLLDEIADGNGTWCRMQRTGGVYPSNHA